MLLSNHKNQKFQMELFHIKYGAQNETYIED